MNSQAFVFIFSTFCRKWERWIIIKVVFTVQPRNDTEGQNAFVSKYTMIIEYYSVTDRDKFE